MPFQACNLQKQTHWCFLKADLAMPHILASQILRQLHEAVGQNCEAVMQGESLGGDWRKICWPDMFAARSGPARSSHGTHDICSMAVKLGRQLPNAFPVVCSSINQSMVLGKAAAARMHGARALLCSCSNWAWKLLEQGLPDAHKHAHLASLLRRRNTLFLASYRMAHWVRRAGWGGVPA